MPNIRAAVLGFAMLCGSTPCAFAQCEKAGFSGQSGPGSQGFTPIGSPRIDLLPDGKILWTIDPGTTGMFAPPNPPWPGTLGTHQEVRCTMRVISSPSVLTPAGAHESGFSVYRGRCVQGGNVVAGVTDESIFISITTQQGVEAAFASAPFDTRSAAAVYHFVATDHGLFFTATSGNRTSAIVCPPGRYSPDSETWRVGGSGAAPAQVQISDWTIARGLPPMVIASSPNQTVCLNQPVVSSVNLANAEGTSVRWQVRDQTNPQSWRDISDGPLFINGTRWGTASGTDTTMVVFVADTGNNRVQLLHRAVATTTCGSSASEPSELRHLPDFDFNGRVDTADLVQLLGHFGTSVKPFCCGDVDGDGTGDIEDLVVILGYFGQACD